MRVALVSAASVVTQSDVGGTQAALHQDNALLHPVGCPRKRSTNKTPESFATAEKTVVCDDGMCLAWRLLMGWRWV